MRITGTVGHRISKAERDSVRSHMTGMPPGEYALAAFDYGDFTDYEVHHGQDRAHANEIACNIRDNGHIMFRVTI